MKKLMLLVAIVMAASSLSAQQINIRKEKNQLYVTHTVLPKESLYSLGRQYHLSPKEIAAANKLDKNAGLTIGQEIKIPLNQNNFSQSQQKHARGLQPVYHTVEKGENLYQLSRSYNNVKQKLLKKWNQLSGDIVKEGQAVVVGYLKYTPQAMPAPAQEEMPVAVSNVQQRDTPRSGTAATRETPQQEPDTREWAEPVATTAVLQGEEGYFAETFVKQASRSQQKVMNGMGASFKSTSGWNDKKYYILINEVPAESVVKVTANGRTIYAKVLESLPGLRDNNGLLCRISNAAASALGISDTRFAISVSYVE